jgi:hypothetical protein
MNTMLAVIAACSSGIFAGAAIYISLVEHPARLECGPVLAVTEFAPSYHRAARMQASLALLGFLSAVGTWLIGSSAWWLVGGLVLGSNIPFTLIVIFPINGQLLSPSLDKNSPQALQLLVQWGKLHRVRSLLGLMAFLIFLLLMHSS